MEVFSGCIRYSNILDVILNGFYAKDGKNVLKSEMNLYSGKTVKNKMIYLFCFCFTLENSPDK